MNNLRPTPQRTNEVSKSASALLEKYLAEHIESAFRPPLSVSKQSIGSFVPLSRPQQQVWLHTQLEPSATAYNEVFTVHRNGPLDVSILEKVLTEILRRHQAWRVTFSVVDGRPMQFLNPVPKLKLFLTDLRQLPPGIREAEALDIAARDAQESFDLLRGPLVRVKLVRVGEEQYKLFFTLHQIIFDGFSIYTLFLKELALLYEAFSQGKPSPLPEPEFQYSDFALWQYNQAQTNADASSRNYWRERLAGEIPLLALPTDYPRPPRQTFRGKLHKFELSPLLTASLRNLCASLQVTTFIGLVASFYGLLFRYTDQEDIVLGTVSAGRHLPQLEQIIGLFINPLVLRIQLSAHMTFAELLARTRELCLGALSHDEVPFEDLVGEFQSHRDPGRNPFFQTMISLQPRLPSLPGWDVTVFDVDSGGSKVDLHLLLDERPQSIMGRAIYNPDLFEASTITRLVDHWQTLLESAVSRPHEHISRLNLTSPSERQLVLTDWNQTRTEYAPFRCIQDIFADQVQRRPKATALIYRRKRISYRDLDRQSNQLARWLIKQGVRRGDFVGVCLDRCPEMVSSLLAVLKVGAAYVPIDPTYPRERVSFIVHDSHTCFIIAQERSAELLQDTGATTVWLDREWAQIRRESSAALEVQGDADDAAYMIYTSGSTGRPKGVIAPHRGAVNRFLWMWQKYPFRAGEICCQKTSLSFVDSVWEIFGPLLAGISTVLVPSELLNTPESLVRELARYRISRIVVVPSLLAVLLDAYNKVGGRLHRPALWISSGEALTPGLATRFRELMPGCALLNLYGCSEIAADATFYEVGELFSRTARVPIGRPIANTQVYILDRLLQPVPIGVVGEIVVGGCGVAHGYWQCEDLTSQNFISNPFSNSENDHLYRTGDLGRWLPDGNIEYVGRRDLQIKMRGYRIELGEIEATLQAAPGIRSAAIAVSVNSSSVDRLVACIVPTPDNPPTATDLRLYLKHRLPQYMIPSHFVFVDALPLLPNGKLHRDALAHLSTTATHTYPDSPIGDITELQLSDIWKDVLKTSDVGAADNFFDIGGHSLLLIQLLHRVEQVFGQRLSVADVFEAPTLEQMAVMLRDGNSVRASSHVVSIQPGPTDFPLYWIRGGPVFRPLGRRLAPAAASFGLHLKVEQVRTLSIPYKLEHVAAAFIHNLRQARPKGPYCLGGLCVNGVIAFEMARQLAAEGEQVPLVIMFDSQNPTCYTDFDDEGRCRIIVAKAKFHLRKIGHLRPDELGSYIGERVAEFRRTMNQRKWQRYQRRLQRMPDHSLGNFDPVIHPAASNYHAQPYSGRVLFFQSSDWPAGQYWQFHIGWQDVISGTLVAHKVPGGHESMLYEANVGAIAEVLVPYLNQLRSHNQDLALPPSTDSHSAAPSMC